MSGKRKRGPVFKRNAGIALVAVLWAVVLLTLIASMVLDIQRTQSRVARRFVDTALAEVAADSALNLTLLKIGTRDPSAPGSRVVPNLRTPAFLQNVMTSIQRERERVDLNAAGSGTLASCFLSAGFSPDTASSMASRVIDWRDLDDVPGPGGAEGADYRAAGLHYGPRNGPFQSVEELRQVLGMDTLRSSVLRLFTVYTHQTDESSGFDGGGDPALASVESAPHCGGPRGGGMAPGLAQQESLIGEVVRVRACATSPVRLCRLVVARLTGNTRNPFQIFVWQTEDSDAE
jgi:general secretion pathway protein K